MTNLKNQYESIVEKYVFLFCQKQDLENNGLVWNNIGEVLACDDMFIYFNDIRHDIDNDIPKGEIIIWHHYVNTYLFAAHLRGIKTHGISYNSYLSGARYEVKLADL